MNDYILIEARPARTGYKALVMKRRRDAPERFIVASGFDQTKPDDPIWYGGGLYFSDLKEAVDQFENWTRAQED